MGTEHLKTMKKVARCADHGPAPVPQEGGYTVLRQLGDINGFSHGVGTCGLRQGACKLTLNVKSGVVQEALIEVVGCSGMTQSAAMAAEILPGKNLLEAMNTDLVCDAINVAMREFFTTIGYGRTQTAYSQGGLTQGAALEDLGKSLRSQLGTSYGALEKGPRYLELSEGYVLELGLDADGRIIGYKTADLGQMMELIRQGTEPNEAYGRATGTFGRFDEAETTIDPRKE